jgi:anti-sigma B factor antagonist
MASDSSGSNVARIALSGELDLADKERLTELLKTAENADEVFIDMREVSYIDSTALGCLIHVKKALLERDCPGPVHLIGPQPIVRRLLEMTHLHEIFDITDD